MPSHPLQEDSDMPDNLPSSRPARSTRPVVRDLRFAGTVAAGLCAGVLGVGAIAAPLVGWNDWPEALKPGNDGTLVVDRPADRNPSSSSDSPARTGTSAPRIGVVGPVGVPTALLGGPAATV